MSSTHLSLPPPAHLQRARPQAPSTAYILPAEGVVEVTPGRRATARPPQAQFIAGHQPARQVQPVHGKAPFGVKGPLYPQGAWWAAPNRRVYPPAACAAAASWRTNGGALVVATSVLGVWTIGMGQLPPEKRECKARPKT